MESASAKGLSYAFKFVTRHNKLTLRRPLVIARAREHDRNDLLHVRLQEASGEGTVVDGWHFKSAPARN